MGRDALATSTQVIAELAHALGHGVAHDGEAYRITIVADPYTLELLVPETVLEWYVGIRDAAGLEIFSHWCDHYGADPAPLSSERESLLAGILRAAGPGRVRVLPSESALRPARVEVLSGELWQNLWELDI